MRLDVLTTAELEGLMAARKVIALVPVGSVEPHGPHLPLATDTLISERCAALAAARLSTAERVAVVAPSVSYGVTDYAGGFAGAVGIPAAVLTPLLEALARGYLDGGFVHVCFVNNHLEPAHDDAVRKATESFASSQVSVACPLARRWGRTLSDEYKSGACHAGRYETSLVLAARPDLVKTETARELPALDLSLSDAIRRGVRTFAELGMTRAYTGAPAEATGDEGHDLYERLVTMVVTEVEEALSQDP